ncbi:MAG: hypothetical protein U1E26_03240 [Coriobacteriia bacterium]|nr:hypothetical protein [Coriobacteriia bacterium]
MATRAAYSDDEWQILQWAVSGTMTFLTMADPGFWDSFKEASGAAKYIAAQKSSADCLLVRDLAGDLKLKKDERLSGNPADLAGEVSSRVSEAAALVASKDVGDTAAFAEFILGLARATAEAVDGVGPNEAAAIAKLEAALS